MNNMDKHSPRLVDPTTIDVPVGDVLFTPAWLPPLPDGHYSVSVTQSVSAPRSNTFPTTSTDFYIKGPRFTLNPGDVFHQHPAPSHVGKFANDLPHIVLNRKTLPWERTLDLTPAGPVTAVDDATPTPWLALFLVDAKDPAIDPPPRGDPNDTGPRVISGTVGDIISPPNKILGPAITKADLDPWESTSDVCQYIDVPAPLYEQLVPSEADLHLLSHVREINTGNTVIDDLKADGSYAVVVGSRLPYSAPNPQDEIGVKNTACLVSLEGFGHYLYDPTATSANLPPDTIAVRLAVLTSWTFFDNGGDNLQVLLESLSFGPLNREARPIVSRPVNRPRPSDPGPEFTNYADYALAQGYTALNHSMRNGEKTVSWYRGPLEPFATPNQADTNDNASDGALRYDPESGMFDVSYAAAWEIGRLIALQSKQFASALHNYYRTWASTLRRQANTATIKRHLALESAPPATQDTNIDTILSGFLKRLANSQVPQAFSHDPDNGRVATKPVSVVDKPSIDPPDVVTTPIVPHEIPTVIADFLGSALLLESVPLRYLIPDAGTLPNESLRYFSVNEVWLERLIDGILSLPGSSAALHNLLRETMGGHFNHVAITNALNRRAFKLRAHGKIASATPVHPETQDRLTLGKGLTGFLLQSVIVSRWKGLEIRAYSSNASSPPSETELPALRIDRVAPGLILALFQGTLQQIVIKEPPQGLRFGVEPGATTNHWEKTTLRTLGGDAPGKAIALSNPFSVTTRAGVPRTIDASATAAAMVDIPGLDLPRGQTELNSADFAIEMILSAAYAVFKSGGST